MLAVAVIASGLAAAILWQRSEEYRNLAEEHSFQELSALPLGIYAGATPERQILPQGYTADRVFREAFYHHQLSKKYWKAAARPWLAVAPDPPPPEP
jgi:hypothetical protein